ncbi:uncharacterized protein LOC128306687 [Anopheles moucheti]|uniref:uncharacterized protein LOC128306687 n=1 Tax=Anopheles moucheti TaxID=186751 RepID=UPI0022F10FC4|nr:uncharacterized protein LOC128306687 [Anopheles moucheti]XP_052900234.1 uncharacterized protein LOC128306687 [Anopheles moucheti]
MATVIPQSLTITVQELLSRFYSPQTNNEEKKAIELKLQELQSTSFNWRTCMAYMNTIENSYVWFFAATTIERTVNLLWKNLTAMDQTQLHTGLFDLFINYPPDVPALQRDKVAQIIAIIARQQCISNENNFDEFVSHVLQLLENKFFLGMALVAAIGDAVTSADTTQATSFTRIVNRHTANIMQALNKYCGLFVILIRGDSQPTVFDSMTDERKNQHCSQLLNVVQQYFSWMKLEQVEPSMVGNISFIACSWQTLRDGAMAAIIALAELLYRNESLTNEAGHQLAQGMYHILHHETIKASDDLYQEKVCDLIRQYIKRGWPYEIDDRSRLLHRLLEFTLCVKTPHALMERINIWMYVCGSRYLDDIENEHCLVGTDLSPEFAKQLMGFLTTTLFFRTFAYLEMLDDEELDENSENEINRFQNQSIDLICQLLRFLNPPMLEEAMMTLLGNNSSSPYVEGNTFFRGMVHSLQGNSEVLQRYENERMTRICIVDYITACNLVVELAMVLYGKHPVIDYAIHQTTVLQIQLFVEISDALDPFLNMCLQMVSFHPHIFHALARIIMQIKLYMQISSSTQSNEGQAGASQKICDIVTHEQKFIIVTKLPAYILHRNTVFHVYWTQVVVETLKLLNLYLSEKMLGPETSSKIFDVLKGDIIHSKLFHLNKATRSLIYRTVCTCILMMYDEANPNTTEITTALQKYICMLASVSLDSRPTLFKHMEVELQEQYMEAITDELQHLTYILSYYESQSTSMRVRLLYAMYPVIEHILVVFRGSLVVNTWVTHNKNGLFYVLLDFCSHSVNILQAKRDLRLLKEIVQVLKELFIEEEKIGKHRLRVALTLLNTFRQLVIDSHCRLLVPSIISVVIDEMLPVITSDERYSEKEESIRYEEVLNRLYELLHDLMHHRWQYFVETNPVARMEPEVRTIIQPESFLAIMNAYGYALLSNTEYSLVVGTVLTSLDMLHVQRNLFRLQQFTEHLMEHFIKLLLKLSVSNPGFIHLEQIIKVLYGMADVDPVKLKTIICSLGMTHDLNTFHMFRTAQDFPTFRMVLFKIINEAKAQPPDCKNFDFLN